MEGTGPFKTQKEAEDKAYDVMEDIEKLFTIANKQDKLFGDVNKWSPADIYFASKIALYSSSTNFKNSATPILLIKYLILALCLLTRSP